MSLIELPVEIHHRIFDFLDTQTIFRSVRCTCNRLHAIVYTYDRFDIKFNLAIKLDFAFIFNLVRPENIISLTFSLANKEQLNVIDLLQSTFDIQRFNRLRSLTLITINDDELNHFLQHFDIFSLVSLSIHLDGTRYDNKKYPLVSEVLAQSNLRQLCLINFNSITKNLSWPIQSNLHHLTIKHCIYQEYRVILDHCPLLQTFVIQNCSMYHIDSTLPADASYSKLTSLALNDCSLSFKDLTMLLSLTPSLRCLKLICYAWGTDLLFDGFQWENFIQTKLKLLTNFHFRFRYSISSCVKSYNLHSIINQYRTPFWLENKRWFVTCDCIIGSSSSSSSQIVLYTMPVYINDFKIFIRCQAVSSNDICYFTKYHDNRKYETDDEAIHELNLEFHGGNSRHIPYVACALKHNKTLVKMNLNVNGIGSEDVQYLTDALRYNTTLTTLTLDRNQIGQAGTKHLAEVLQNNTTLTTLSIGGNQIEEAGVQHLEYLLQNNKTLTNLHIGGNRIGPKGVLHIANVLENNTTLTVLDLQDNQIQDEGIYCLCKAIEKNLGLTTLNISSNQIDSSQVQYLANLLKNNTTLISLNLRDNEIRSKGCEYLSYALQTNLTLTSINLQFNHIDDDGAEYLGNTLKINTTLKTLILHNNQITGTGARYLADGLQNNTSLTTLDLGRNHIGVMGAKHLASLFQTNTNLKILNLYDNRIKDQGAIYLATTLEMNMTFTTLDIGSNCIGNEGAQRIIHALQTNKTLTTLNLEYNPIDVDLNLLINKLIEKNVLQK